MSRCLVTGANRGIGLELCRQLSQRGDEVIAVCREPSPALTRLRIRIEAGVDLADGAALRDLARSLSGVGLDLLINNAGLLERVALEQLDVESIRRQFEINALAPLCLTRALLDNLQPNSRLALITSLMGSMADNASGGSYGYRMSKAALNAAGVSLSHDLRARRIAVAILHPGMVATEMTGGQGISAEQAARGLLERIDGLTLENSGTFWHADGRILPW